MAKVVTQGRPILITLTAKGLHGGQTITLTDESGEFKLTFPSQLWEWILPGDEVVMTFSPIKVAITNDPAFSVLPPMRRLPPN